MIKTFFTILFFLFFTGWLNDILFKELFEFSIDEFWTYCISMFIVGSIFLGFQNAFVGYDALELALENCEDDLTYITLLKNAHEQGIILQFEYNSRLLDIPSIRKNNKTTFEVA